MSKIKYAKRVQTNIYIKNLKNSKLWSFISYSQNNSTTKIYSKNILLSKIDYKWKFEFEKKFRAIIKNIDAITNIFRNISKLENQNDFNNYNSIITIKNHDEIVKILKRHFENKIIFNDNNHVCFN